MRCIAVFAVLLAASTARADERDCACDLTPAACDVGCACDDECTVDWSVDECAAPGAGCSTTPPLTDDQLDAAELAQPVDTDVDWDATAAIDCPDGTTLVAGACTATAVMTTVTGGCSTGRDVGALAVGAVLLWIARKRRREVIALVIVACTQDALDWDGAVDDGNAPADLVDVYAADVGNGTQFVLAHQPLAAGAEQPVAAFALSRTSDGVPIARITGACGDRLVPASKADDELLGYAHAQSGDGTAALVELVDATGCYAYETDNDAIDDLVARGYAQLGTIAYVWPPGLADRPVLETDVVALSTPAACTITKHSAVQLMYASPGVDESLRFLVGCPGEVIVGEKRELGPIGAMKSAAAHAAGGRSAFVLDRHGDKLRALLNRANGVERTAAYLRHKLAIGYDYIVLDEVTTAGDYADGQAFNHQLRELLLRIPPRALIPYISIDLVQEANGAIYMHDRRFLLRAFQRRTRSLALEVYLHTGEVMAGAAPATFRRAADRLANAVAGMAGTRGIDRAAISTIGTSMHSSLAQYRYLDQPAHDLDAITREVNAIRHASRRTRSQHGVGWYFVDKSDMAPVAHYTYDALINRMRTQALRFK